MAEKTTKDSKKKAQGDPKPKDSKQTKDSKQSKGKGKGKGKGKADKTAALPKDYLPRLLDFYRKTGFAALQKQFGYDNPMLVPKLEKIVLNVGMGTLHQDAKLAESITQEMTLMSGQHPVLTHARLSVANFKLRQGMVVGSKVTLRGFRMFEFLDRLISIVIPRIRDFRGLSDKSFDGRGNFTFGVKEQIIFPEIDYDTVVQIHGMDITICTSARTDDEALALLKTFGFPFRQRGDDKEAA